MSSKFFSIVIPTYNSEKVIEGCLESLIKQNFPKNFFEIIVVDSGKDNTRNICLEFGVSYFYCEECNSPGAARNYGIKKAKGNILAFIDSDCIAPEDWLSRIASSFDSYSDIVGVLGYYEGGKDFFQRVLNEEFWNEKVVGFFKGCVEGNAAFKKIVFEKGCKFGEHKWFEGNVLLKQLNEKGFKTLSDHSLRVIHKTPMTFKKFFASGRSFYHNSLTYFNSARRSSTFSIFLILSLIGLFLFVLFNYVFLVAPFILANLILGFFIARNERIPFKYLLASFPYLLTKRWIFWLGFFYELISYR